MQNTYCIIIAGGLGRRFWPLSNPERPKQFFDILGIGQTFIQMTYRRFKQVCPPENIIVVVNEAHHHLVKEQLPELSDQQILLEPIRRNTAPSIAYAASKIKQKCPKANLIITPADQVILHEQEFFFQLETALRFVRENRTILSLGTLATRPETSFGYIQVGDPVDEINLPNVYSMKTFTEKPNEEMANIFYESGEFFWNTGIIVSSMERLEKGYAKHQTDMHESFFQKGQEKYGTSSESDFVRKAYSECSNISIDYAILERITENYTLCADFGWSDIGTWTNAYYQLEKDENQNVRRGEDIYCYEAERNIIHSETDRLVVLHGVNDYIVVDTPSVLMLCKKNNEKKILHFLNDIRLKTNRDL
ncbi:MAG: mannose-1-phosphate guanylyltransferase [Bacteroidales bacterium]